MFELGRVFSLLALASVGVALPAACGAFGSDTPAGEADGSAAGDAAGDAPLSDAVSPLDATADASACPLLFLESFTAQSSPPSGWTPSPADGGTTSIVAALDGGGVPDGGTLPAGSALLASVTIDANVQGSAAIFRVAPGAPSLTELRYLMKVTRYGPYAEFGCAIWLQVANASSYRGSRVLLRTSGTGVALHEAAFGFDGGAGANPPEVVFPGFAIDAWTTMTMTLALDGAGSGTVTARGEQAGQGPSTATIGPFPVAPGVNELEVQCGINDVEISTGTGTFEVVLDEVEARACP